MSLLKGDRFGCLDSIIVYCTRREETVRVAALLRTCLQGVLVKENKHRSGQTQANPVGQRKKDLGKRGIKMEMTVLQYNEYFFALITSIHSKEEDSEAAEVAG